MQQTTAWVALILHFFVISKNSLSLLWPDLLAVFSCSANGVLSAEGHGICKNGAAIFVRVTVAMVIELPPRGQFGCAC